MTRALGIVEKAAPFDLVAVGTRAAMYAALRQFEAKGIEGMTYVYVEPEGAGLYRVCATSEGAPVGRVLMLK